MVSLMIQAGLDRPDYLGILPKILIPLFPTRRTPHESRRHDGYYENGYRGPLDDEFSLFTFTVRCRNCHFQGSANQLLQTGRRQETGPHRCQAHQSNARMAPEIPRVSMGTVWYFHHFYSLTMSHEIATPTPSGV